MLVLFIYITRRASNEIFSPSNKILIITVVLLPIIIYTIPTVTNNKEISIHDKIIENEIITTTTVIYNQIIGTITTLLVLYILLTLIVVVNIINVSKGPLRHTALEGISGQQHTPAVLYFRERPGTHCTGGWVGPRAGLDRCGKSRPHRDSIPGPSSP
jgi:hypothetical protein